ncbi:MAG: MarR family transcriptional regulator, partial [Spirochaetaceae bacterium]
MESLDRAPDTIKKRNRSRVFSILAAQGRISRPELARASGLNRATISSVTEDLAALDLVREVGPGHSRGGRPPMLLEFNPDAAYALGASMRDHSWTLVRTNLVAHIVDRET